MRDKPHRIDSSLMTDTMDCISIERESKIMKMLDSRIEGNGSQRAIEIGKAMKDARIAAGLGLRETAGIIGVSPTHLARIESGERLMDSLEKLIAFCELVHEPIEKYLVIAGMNIPDQQTPVRKAFPSITTDEQEQALTSFARIITSLKLTPDDYIQLINSATAYAEFCDKKNNTE